MLAAALASSGRMEEAERIRAALASLLQRPCGDDSGPLVAQARTVPCP